ncbi:DMT family transporter [Acidaminobacter sp. JC074]|uniref:DMT family transporter n=1 Tax=Acidaminobacter sp. JC074 TaxID=2530199 RepID=UPI001F0CEEFE|nr:DMT family transporter [Acidaminobacter sp. JC074]
MKTKENTGVFLIIISAIAYALMPIFSVNALEEGTAVSNLLFMRFSTAALILWLYIYLRKIPFKTSIKNLIYIIAIALLGFTIATSTLYTSYKHISSSIATLILFTHPVFVLIFEKIITKSKVTKRKVLALIITIIGLFIVLYVKEPLSSKGIIYAFVASITYGAYCLGLSEKETQKLGGVVVTAYVATTTSLAMGIQCILTDMPLVTTQASTVTSALLLAFVSTILASITFYEGLSIVGPSSATLISSVEPMFVVLFSAWLLNEVFTMNTILGGLIIILGIVILEYKKKDNKSLPLRKSS